jgi:putative transposase
MKTQLRRSPRLKDFNYMGPLACSLTLVTRQRAPIFVQPELGNLCLDCLWKSSQKHGVTVNAYCLMPDHAHVLVEVPEGTSLKAFVRHFKQLSGYTLKQKTGSEPWQISYYDHILRNDESILDVARYIWDNPVRKGLVSARAEYPFSGPRHLLDSWPADLKVCSYIAGTLNAAAQKGRVHR